jgi:hypothetical protein
MRCLEIGSFEGRSTIYTAENYCNGKGSYIDALDLWGTYPGYTRVHQRSLYDHFVSNLQNHIEDQRVHIHRGYSFDSLMKIVQEVRAGTKDKYNFIYVDASHTAKDALMDAVLSWEVLQISGVMIFDDYDYSTVNSHVVMSPKIAVDGFLEIYACMYEVLHKGYQVHIKKTSDNQNNANEDCPSKVNSLFYDYTVNQDIDGLKGILPKVANVDYIHPIGSTALYMAVEAGFEIAKALLAFGADTEIKSKNGASPLYISVGNGDDPMVELLLEYNASTANTNKAGYTPLHAAAHHGFDNILQLLLAKGANKLVEVNGESPFKMALNMDHLSSATILAGGEEEFCQELQGTGFEMKYVELCGEVAVEA